VPVTRAKNVKIWGRGQHVIRGFVVQLARPNFGERGARQTEGSQLGRAFWAKPGEYKQHWREKEEPAKGLQKRPRSHAGMKRETN